jgi:hypothetical protein
MPLLVSMASQIPWDILRGMKGCCLWGWLCSTVQVQIPVELKYGDFQLHIEIWLLDQIGKCLIQLIFPNHANYDFKFQNRHHRGA